MLHRKKVPFIAGRQLTDCGIACVAMILKFYGSNKSMSDFKKILEVGRDGTTLLEVNRLLKLLNFETKIYRIPADKIHSINLPAIIFLNKKHFAVLEKIKKYTFYLVDPAYGRHKIDFNEFSKNYSGLALYPFPNEKFIIVKRKNNILKNFYPIIFKEKHLYFKILFFALITYIFTLGIPILIQYTIDSVSSKNNRSYTTILFLILSIILIFLSFTDYIKNKYSARLKILIDRSLNSEAVSHLMKLPYKFFDVRNKQDILFTLNNSYIIRETLAGSVTKGIIDLGSVIFILIFIGVSSKVLSLTAGILLIINIFSILWTKRNLTDTNKEALIEQNKLEAFKAENINTILSLKMSSLESIFLKNFELKLENFLKKYNVREKYNNKINAWFIFLNFISPIIILYISIVFMIEQIFTIGQVIAFYSLANTLFALTHSLSNAAMSYVQCKLILERLDDILTEEVEPETGLSKKEIKGNIRLKNVSFSYTKSSKKVLKNINLNIKENTKVAIVGKSGSGKTTLVKILAGLYLPTEGNVFLEDISLNEFDKKYMHGKIGVIPQDVFLFNKSILENIVMNDEDIPLKKVKEICSLTQIKEEIESMPMGYNTIVSEYGQNISGGQRQRIILARALLHNPKILIFDESTSSLDNINERKISSLLANLGCTRIIVTHRISSIIDSNNIIVMDEGEIIGTGTHKELIENCRFYKSLL
ncbi:MAG: peptidase domain-containing ABC transporter [Oscillospiraceae bacterium]|jgi:ABC-type bacteriocin/lantibiotic exporter with double-glycine peptidase domain|nr:peptidase domain-containing ABC transporter [Oscillospiraceae bacterium]